MLDFDTYYHVYNRANGDDNLFREEKNYAFFLKKYHRHIDPIAESIAWCLMPNHFHLLIKIRNEEEIAKENSTFLKFKTLEKFEKRKEAQLKFLSKQFSNFFSSYTQAFNKVYSRRGSLFIKSFKSKAIVDDNNLRNVILYIHLNPVKHGFTDEIEDWKYTSYPYFSRRYPGLINELFDDEDNFKWLHQNKGKAFNEYVQLENKLT